MSTGSMRSQPADRKTVSTTTRPEGRYFEQGDAADSSVAEEPPSRGGGESGAICAYGALIYADHFAAGRNGTFGPEGIGTQNLCV